MEARQDGANQQEVDWFATSYYVLVCTSSLHILDIEIIC